MKKFSLDLNALVPNDFERLLIYFKYTDGCEDFYLINMNSGKSATYAFTPITNDDFQKDYDDGDEDDKLVTLKMDYIDELYLLPNVFARFRRGHVHQAATPPDDFIYDVIASTLSS